MVSSPIQDDLVQDLEPLTDDDRSSSLSELDDGLDGPNAQLLDGEALEQENDTEAETERLENSPHKLIELKRQATSPSKLGPNAAAEASLDAQKFSDSAMSSPISSDIDVWSGDEDEVKTAPGKSMGLLNHDALLLSSQKRKRSMLDDEIHAIPADIDDGSLPRRKRIRSVEVNDEDQSDLSETEEQDPQDTREASVEAVEKAAEEESDTVEGEDEKVDQDQGDPVKLSVVKRRPTRRKPLNTDGDEANTNVDREEGAPSDEEDVVEGDEAADDAEAMAKSEEELQKRMTAMEELTSIEKRFATFRDRLYDERIADINNELAQLQNPNPTHPELLRQFEAVQKYRDDKFEHEQKLLVCKVGALKRKSVAERSQIHSAYYQTIRDVREDYLERISEHFYRIQRDRFKTDTKIPEYSVPFPERRSVQISQQTAYNKEVSILSGLAKHVGFPAAPGLVGARQKEIEEDLEKMGISPTPIRPANKSRTSAVMSYAQSSRPAAEEQFLEQNPWANPQHPVHRFNLNRQLSQSSPPPVEQVTPAQPTTTTLAAGSASTIVENPSAQASSMANTPYEDKIDPRNGVASTSHPTYRNDSASPFEARKAGLSNATASAVNSTANANGISVNPNDAEPNSSPLATRTVIPPAKTASPPPRAPEQDMDHLQQRLDGAVSPPPSILDRLGTTKDSGTNIMSSAGLTRFKV